MFAMVIDWTISIGNILTLVSTMLVVIVASFKLGQRVQQIESSIEHYAEKMLEHTRVMERHDKILVELVGDVHKLFGMILAKKELNL